MYKCGILLTFICDVKFVVSRFKIWYSAAWPLLWYKTAIAEFIYVKQCGLFHGTKVYDTGGRKGCASWWKQGWWGGGQCQLDPLIFFHLGKPSEIQNYTIAQMHFYPLVKMGCQFDPSNFFPSQWRTLQRVSKLNTHGYCAWQNGQRGSQTNI